MCAAQAQPSQSIPGTLTDQEYSAFQMLASEMTGINLTENKRSMVYARFARRLRALNLTCFSEYLDFVKGGDVEETRYFVNTITTNLTYFFREPHHFDALKSQILPSLAEDATRQTIKVWSAGSSSGQEAYSVAMVLAESSISENWTKKILATDIDTEMVAKTHNGIYSTEELRGLNDVQTNRWFEYLDDGRVQACNELRSMLICKELNLFDRWPIAPTVDVIFCRNVLIYFDKANQEHVVRSFSKLQEKGQFLFLGHSESLRDIDDIYRRIGNTLYRRV